MSKTMNWYLELEENGVLSLYLNEVEDIEYEVVKEEEEVIEEN